jgi:hypothetical protein
MPTPYHDNEEMREIYNAARLAAHPPCVLTELFGQIDWNVLIDAVGQTAVLKAVIAKYAEAVGTAILLQAIASPQAVASAPKEH